MPEVVSTPFALATFAFEGRMFPAVVVDETAYDLRRVLPGVLTTGDLFRDWESKLDSIADRLSNPIGLVPTRVHDLKPLPPVQPVGAVIAAGANYREHVLELAVAHKLGRSDATDDQLREEAAAETDERARNGHPYVWVGLTSAVSGAEDDVLLPAVGADVDWEVELGVIVAKDGYAISTDDAPSYIAGYVICNDLSVRSLIPRRDVAMMGTDWFRAKNAPGFYPTGPYLLPARFAGPAEDLRIHMTLNGTVMQDATAEDLLFDVPQLISYVSSHALLRAGDMLITGSPPGNGSHWGRFLRDGDVMEATISGLGRQRNVVRSQADGAPPWYRDRSAV